MIQASSPKAYLITADHFFEDFIDSHDKEQGHILEINTYTYLVDVAHYLRVINDWREARTSIFCAVPIFDSIAGHFSSNCEEWFRSRSIQIQYTRRRG